MSKLSTLRRRWRKDQKFRAEYDALEEEIALTAATGTRLTITFEPNLRASAPIDG